MALSRIEDRRLITGRGRYTADWNLPGQLHAAMLRSDRPHADIVRLDAAPALALPGVHAVITAADLDAAGFKPYPWGVAYNGRNDQPMKKARHPILAESRVRFVGQPIAMVVADTAAIAADAVERVVVEYADRPAVASIDAAIAPGAPLVHDEIAGNLAFDFESGDAAAVDAAFARARFVTRLTLDSQRLLGVPMEPRACLVAYDAQADRYAMHVPTQGLNGMLGQLTAVTGLAADRFEVIAQDIGGSFGIRAVPFPEYLAAMVASRRLGRPVKWSGARADSMLADTHGRALRLSGELALDADGRFLAIRFDDFGDLGGYPTAFGAFIATRNLSVTAGGVYRIPAIHVRSRCVYTNTTPVSAYRGAGRPDIAYAIERLVDQAAAEHGFDRVALRRRNFVPPSAMPYATANGNTYDSGEFEAAMDACLAAADWAGFAARRAESARAGRLRGIGIATYLEASGGGTAAKDQVVARFDRSGALHIHSVAMASGQGHETSFSQIVAGALGVAVEDVRYHGSDPRLALVGNGTGGSRSLYGQGSAFKRLGEKLIEVARPHAAGLLECAAADLEYANGAFRVAGSDRAIGFLELARRLATGIAADAAHPLDTEAEASSGVTFPNGCHIAEVEIDPATGVARCVAYTCVDDFGRVVSPQLVEGQVHGGVMQGIGQVFGEDAIYDPETAQFLTATFMDYVMPRAGWLPPTIRRHERPVPTTTNALGAKGVGESGCSGALPAVMNAVMDAVRPLGVPPLQMPVTPARLWAALRAARSSN
jgi:carbon-monoxide dehydrogenase large subunit